MTIYVVTDKVTGEEKYRYDAEQAIEWRGFEFSTHDHVPQVEAPAPEAQPTSPRRLTKLAYMNRFTDIELGGIYAAAQVSPSVTVWLKKFEAATPEADGTAIDLDDPRTIAGLQALEQAGLIGQGRAEEILNG